MNEKLPQENDCKREAAILDDIGPGIFAYADRKRLTHAPFREYERLRDEWEDYPEGWDDGVHAMLASSALMCSRKRVAAFVRAERDTLTEKEFSLVRRWRTHPWWYCAFRVLDVRDKSFPVAEPIGDAPASWGGDRPPERMMLHSPSVGEQYRRGKELFIALLWEGEHAYYTYGLILGFSSITETDLYFFTDILRTSSRSPMRYPLKGVTDRSRGISDAMMEDPLSFLRLIQITDAPRMQSRRGRLLRSASVVSVSDIDSLSDEEQWRKACDSAGETLHRIIFENEAAAIYLGEGSPMYDPVIYLSYPDSRVFLEAMTEEGYERGRAAAMPLCAFPQSPQLQASMPIDSSAKNIFDYEDELILLEDSFGDLVDQWEEPDGFSEEEEGLPTSDELDAISHRLFTNYNEGIEEEDAEIARALGVEEAKVAAVREKVSSILERMNADGARPADRYGLTPRAFKELSTLGVPDARGALRLREAREIHREIERRGLKVEDLFAASAAFSFAYWFLDKAHCSGAIPATQAGYVATKVVREAYEEGIIPSPGEMMSAFRLFAKGTDGEMEEYLKPKKESDWKEFHRLRGLLEDAGLIDYDGKRFRPGKNAEYLLGDPAELYLYLLRIMFTKREWDYSALFGAIPFLRTMAGFLFYAIGKLSREEKTEPSGKEERGWFTGDRLTERYIAAVPPIAERVEVEDAGEDDDDEYGYFNVRKLSEHAVQLEFLTFFAESFGLVEIERNGFTLSEFRLRPTPLYEVVFEYGPETSP